MEELVSIIIPVYNVEEYLDECIQSVINQTYKNLEIWIVDDGSKDSSGKMCDKYKEKDSRIKVIHKPNGGLSSARNAALDKITGEYVFFLDSDDYIALDFIETHLELMIKNDADVVMGTAYEFLGEVKNTIDYSECDDTVEVFDVVTALKMMFLDDKLHHDAAGPLYKSYLFKSIRFPVGMLYEDFATTYYVINNAEKVVYIDDKRYFYRMRPGSIMNSKVTERDMVLLDIADKVAEDIPKLHPELQEAAVRKKVVTNVKLYSRILYTGLNSFKNEQKRIRNTVLENADVYLSSADVRKIDKLKVKVLSLGKILFYIMYRASDAMQKIRKENK